MSLLFRLLLFVISIGSLVFVLRKIRRADAEIDSAVFWILFMLGTVVISASPRLIMLAADWFGIESPANFVFLCIIFLLLLKVFNLSLHVSKLQYQIRQLAQTEVLTDYYKKRLKSEEKTL